MNSGDAAWMLASSAMVLLMTPGLAFFYGGMVRSKSVLNMLMMNFACIGVVTLLWVLFGYSLAFKGTNPLIGNFDAVGLKGTISGIVGSGSDKYPELIFSAFQLMFAIITPALISGAVADRIKFGAWVTFVALWTTIVYFPVAHWVFYFNGGKGGWIGDHLHAMDFAGGTAVHINAGAAGLALALVLRKRVGWRREPMRPHNLPLVLLGAGLLWFGWFGFNAGSALTSGAGAALAFMNTQVATACAALGWIVVEKLRDGHSTTLGIASGAVAGLVAITPACGSINPLGAILLGFAAGAACAYAVGLKFRFGFDDSLDVVGVHLVGGVVGTLAIGFLATTTAIKATGSLGDPGFWDGAGATQLGRQALAAVTVLAYSFVVAAILGKIIDKTIGFTIDREAEVSGIDTALHAESAYEFGVSLGGALSGALGGGSRAAVEAPTSQSQERIDA